MPRRKATVETTEAQTIAETITPTEPKKRQYNRTKDSRKGVLCKFEKDLYDALAKIATAEERDIDKQIVYFVKQAIKKLDPEDPVIE